MIAAIRVRGDVDVTHKTSRTLNDLKLTKKNKVVFFEENDSILGMLNKGKDYITYGEVSQETLDEISEKKDVDLEHGATVNLRPPTGGYKSTKKQVGQGGTLGKRESMDELLLNMI